MSKVTIRYKAKWFLIYLIPYFALYVFPNLFPLASPTLLTLTRADSAVPFLPWAFLIYISDYLLVWCAVCLLRTHEEFNPFVRHVFGVLIICGIFFLVFPTTYPRPSYPDLAPSLVSFAMNLVGGLDTPNNCFPSHHVAVTSVAAWAMRRRSRPLFALFLLWSLAIFFSTLATKQHYAVDILGGLLTALAVLGIDKIYSTRRYLA